MVTFDKFVSQFGKLEKHLISKSGTLLMKNEGKIIALNNKQLLEGKNALNKTMQTGYSGGYSTRRRKAGLQTGFVDLKFSGKYQDSKRGVKVADGMNIESGVDYEKYLRGNFPNHVGLTDKNSEAVAELLSDEVAVLIEKYLTK